MGELGLTIASLAAQSGVQPRTIQGWLTEGRHPWPTSLVKVENAVGPLSNIPGLEAAREPTIKEALRRLRAAEREISFAREILDHFTD